MVNTSCSQSDIWCFGCEGYFGTKPHWNVRDMSRLSSLGSSNPSRTWERLELLRTFLVSPLLDFAWTQSSNYDIGFENFFLELGAGKLKRSEYKLQKRDPAAFFFANPEISSGFESAERDVMFIGPQRVLVITFR